jgi:hypothetical protein
MTKQNFLKNGHSPKKVPAVFCPVRRPNETRNGGTHALPFCHMYRARTMALGDYWHTTTWNPHILFYPRHAASSGQSIATYNTNA